MCSIFGFSGKCGRGQWHQVRRLLHELFVASAVRGTDAAGFAALTTRGVLVGDKQPLAGPLFSATSRAWLTLPDSRCVVGHCRAATHGSPDTGDNRNNHPFVSEAEGLAAVVNGVSHNYRQVAADHGLRLAGECDSEVVLRLVEAADAAAEGVRVALDELHGGLAVAVLDRRRRSVLLARNAGRPIWLFEVDGLEGRFFASTAGIVLEGHRRAYQGQPRQPIRTLVPVAADHVIELSVSGQMLVASGA